MAFTVFVDACVLFSAAQRDILLRMAGIDVFRVKWSDDVLVETSRNLQRQRGLGVSQTDRLIHRMTQAFPDACVSQERYASLIESMPVNPKDRHVLAAAIVARVDVLVTWNVTDFPLTACASYGIDIQTPDNFLVTQAKLAPQSVLDALDSLIRDLRKPLITISQWLEQQEDSLPQFVCWVRDQYRDSSDIDDFCS
ncbi:MAG: PIN domain-containing protein [Sulfobacillus acidophilus]|uniref:PIN domain-containing protein n=1 Tax=Sulfobacillus acidophilus TaxID=53633 RepID=A0A2T2WHB9_9FIRM|nr:MAG: PIN domain-containing protein [Sulfobacillus acidophilus]